MIRAISPVVFNGLMSDGTVGSPGLRFQNDIDTGFYRVGANTLGIAAGGVQVAYFGSASVKTGAFYTDLSTGYMGFGRTDPTFPMDFNWQSTDIDPASADHMFHMYAEAAASSLSAVGQMTGFYGHLDGDLTVTSGKSVSSMYPHRGNLTWRAAGTLTQGAGILAGARLIEDRGGVITNGYGGRFEAATEAGSTGTFGQAAYGVSGEVRASGSGIIPLSYGLKSLITVAAAGTITEARGINLGLGAIAGTLGGYYGLYIDSTVVANANYSAIYSVAAAKSYIQGSVAIGSSVSSASSKLLVQDNWNGSLATLRNTTNSGSTAVLRLLQDRVASNGFNFLTLETDTLGTPKTVLSFRGDGAIFGTETTGASAPPANGYILYADDNGSGKTRLMVRFQSGTAQQIAIEP